MTTTTAWTYQSISDTIVLSNPKSNTSTRTQTGIKMKELQRTIVNIVPLSHRIPRIIHYERATQAVAVLSPHVRVVPERACLVGHNKIVRERMVRRDRALAYERRAVRPDRVCLKDAVPVLVNRTVRQCMLTSGRRDEMYDGRAALHGVVAEMVDDVDLEAVALRDNTRWLKLSWVPEVARTHFFP